MKAASPKRRRSRRRPPKLSAVEKTAVRIMRKVYEATGGQPQRWESLGNLGAVKADAAAGRETVEKPPWPFAGTVLNFSRRACQKTGPGLRIPYRGHET